MQSLGKPSIFCVLIGALGTTSCAGDGPAVPDWENPAVVGNNKEPPHATYTPYPDVGSALSGDRESSPFRMSLNGTWKFNWVRTPAERPIDFYEDDFDASGWNDIAVPGNWALPEAVAGCTRVLKILSPT